MISISWNSAESYSSSLTWMGTDISGFDIVKVPWRPHKLWRSHTAWGIPDLVPKSILLSFDTIPTLCKKVGSVLNIEAESRVPYILSLAYTNELTGEPVDITGYSAFLQVRRAFGGREVLLSLSSVDSSIILEEAKGVVNAIFTQDMLDGSLWTRGAYDLVIKDTNLTPTKLVKGFLTINI